MLAQVESQPIAADGRVDGKPGFKLVLPVLRKPELLAVKVDTRTGVVTPSKREPNIANYLSSLTLTRFQSRQPGFGAVRHNCLSLFDSLHLFRGSRVYELTVVPNDNSNHQTRRPKNGRRKQDERTRPL